MANDTSTRSGGGSGARRAKRGAASRGAANRAEAKRADSPPPGRKPTKATVDARMEAQRIRKEAETEAARVRAEAEEHARRLVLDARASAEGVRAEGMELVSNLREMSDVLRSNADRLLQDVQAIHSRMIGELERVTPVAREPARADRAEPDDPEPGPTAPEPGPTAPEPDDSQLAIPDFVSRR